MKPAAPPPGTPIPMATFFCAVDSCAKSRSHPADELYWVDDLKGWYCWQCIENDPSEREEKFARERRLAAALLAIAKMRGCECDSYHGHRCLMCRVRTIATEALNHENNNRHTLPVPVNGGRPEPQNIDTGR